MQRTDPELTEDEAEGPALRERVDSADRHHNHAHHEVGHRETHDEHVARLSTEKTSVKTSGVVTSWCVCKVTSSARDVVLDIMCSEKGILNYGLDFMTCFSLQLHGNAVILFILLDFQLLAFNKILSMVKLHLHTYQGM